MQSRMIFDVTEKLPSCHACTLAELGDGTIMAAWYAGTAEKEPDVNIFGAGLKPGADQWSPFFSIIEDPVYSLGNPVLFYAAGPAVGPASRRDSPSVDIPAGRRSHGKLFLFWPKMMGNRDWDTCRIFWRVSNDDGKTWGPDRDLREQLGCMIKYPPTILDSGEYLLGTYDEIVGITRWYLSDDLGESWREISVIKSIPGNSQAQAVQRRDGTLLAYMRCNKKGAQIMALISSESNDRGRTWSRGVHSALPNPDAAASLIKLQSGRFLLVYNNSPERRSPLSVAFSDDEGRTWKNAFDLESGEGSFAYPHAIQARDGNIHAAYSFHRAGIKHVTFSETEL